jgi:hypothetical protein
MQFCPGVPEWKKCPQCGRENSVETWNRRGGNCPNCGDLHDKEASPAPQPEPTPLEIILSKRDQEAVVNSLINPPEPNDNLKRLVAEQPSPAGAREPFLTLAKRLKPEQFVTLPAGELLRLATQERERADAFRDTSSLPAGARERKENEVMKTIRDANGTTMWWGKPLAGRGEAAEQEQNKAGISASSGTTFITSSAPNERPASSPAGARESAEQFFNSLPEETKYKWAGEVKPHWAFAFAEAYAKKERERADAAERVNKEITRLGRELVDEVESLRTELREAREALQLALVPLAALVLSGECVNARTGLCDEVKLDVLKAHDAILALLSRKGEGS